MKIKSLFILPVLLGIFMNCSHEETNDTNDFSLLGIEEIVIDQTVIEVDQNGFPDTNSGSFTMVGFTNQASVRSYDLVIRNIMPGEEAIKVNGRYDDLTTTIEKNEENGFYNVIVSRKGFEEKLIYKIAFIQY